MSPPIFRMLKQFLCALILFAVVLVALAVLSGCGNAALKTNLVVATGFVETQAQAEPVIRRGRVEAAIQSAQSVRDSGGSIEEATAAAAAETERWECALDAHAIFALATKTYVDSLTLAAAGDTFELSYMVPLLGRAVRSYDALRRCLVSLGRDDLPETPDFIRSIPVEWNVGLDEEEREQEVQP